MGSTVEISPREQVGTCPPWEPIFDSSSKVAGRLAPAVVATRSETSTARPTLRAKRMRET